MGRRGGEVYTKLDQLERRLAGWGIKLERNADNYLDATGLADGKKYGAMFEGSVKGNGTFYLRADATRYEVLHELSHVLDFRKGPNAWVRAEVKCHPRIWKARGFWQALTLQWGVSATH